VRWRGNWGRSGATTALPRQYAAIGWSDICARQRRDVRDCQRGGVAQFADFIASLDASTSGVLVQAGTATGQLSIASGKVASTVAAGDIATDALTAAAVKADAVTKIQAGLSTYAGTDPAGVNYAVDARAGYSAGTGPADA